MDALMLQVSDLQSQGDNTKIIIVTLVKQYILQHELDSHGLMVDALKNLLVMVEVSHVTVVVKNSKVQQEWKRITSKMDVWKRQKATLCTQVQCMKSYKQYPSLNPSPLLKKLMESDISPILTSYALILPCPFCLRGFAPLWDSKLNSIENIWLRG